MVCVSLLPLLMVLLMGSSVVPGAGGGKKPPPAPHFLAQAKWECRFSNGTQQVRYLYRYIYDRQDLVRFDSARGDYEAVTPLGEPTAKYWNSQEGILREYRSYVDRFCRYNYGVAEQGRMVGRKVQPSVSISPTKEDPLSPHTLLLCTAASFYPLEIEIQWLKNGQEQKEGVFYAEELRNGDWTYQTQVMLETKPEHGDVYTCQVEHASLEAPITVQWEPRKSDSARSKVWTGAMGAVLGVVFVAVGLSLYLKKKKATPIQPPAALIG
ncbi:H-2 class II histocompatibility antigen, E-S beta chain-like isoform X2 [Elgaria multicarinata webbii]|uniref:H-2 class II histocompatibility antigen, E-S beta chain-like isoform X2 n=1 Tax=Elgaria multicarinata webbii TaxID=159646 RepID=UPI002FCCE332